VTPVKKDPDFISRVDHVYAILRSGVISGRYRPGEQMRVQELADETGSSASPVREALRRLQSESLIEFLPNRGARVPKVSEQELRDLFRTRRLLEGQAIALAHPRLTKEILNRGFALIDEMTKAFEHGDSLELEKLHRSVHFALYEPSESPWLLRLIGVLWDNSARYVAVFPVLRVSAAAFSEEHARIFRIAASRPVDEAVAELHRHLENKEKLMLSNYYPKSRSTISGSSGDLVDGDSSPRIKDL
jgi:DNA-binding GntR family transcriptional regulator